MEENEDEQGEATTKWGRDKMGKGGACGLSPCRLWVVADEMGKGRACGLSLTKCGREGLVGCGLSLTMLVGAGLGGRKRGENGREFGREGKGRRWR